MASSPLPLSKPVYLREVARRMSRPGQPVTVREARTHLRRLEYAKKIQLLFKNGERNSHLWTTEALLRSYCRELHDRPQRALNEVRGYQGRVKEMIAELREELGSEIDELRSLFATLERRMVGRDK